jgi:hypothetical protein
MAYNNFTLASAKEQFGLSLTIDPFCKDLPTAVPSAIFAAIFAEWLPIAQQAKSEKARMWRSMPMNIKSHQLRKF